MMYQNKKILYTIIAVLGLSTSLAGAAMAARGHLEQKGHRDAPVVEQDKDGSLFPGGGCKRCSKAKAKVPGTCNKCLTQQVPPAPQVQLVNYVPYNPVIPAAMQGNCCQMAPLALEHVDFRLKGNPDEVYSNHLGNYRFRIFGCRRFNKEANLNEGRIMEKDISFSTVFENAVGDCYKILPVPHDLCLQNAPAELPEYILTAEITDYFMNLCDEYDWDKSEKSDVRSGSSEITVLWRLMDISKNNLYWYGETTGYGELRRGETDGEIKLIERAFADASSNLRAAPGFEKRLLHRPDPMELEAQRSALIEEERALNPMKCGYMPQYECAKNCELSRPGADLSLCCPQPFCGCPAPVCSQGGVYSCGCQEPEPVIYETGEVIESCFDENGQIIPDGNCQVVDDTWVDTGDVSSLDQLCIVTTDPCKALSPETVYRMRSSLVQIDSPNGRKGTGLLISDRYILTSGDLVDAQHNVYKVKTINNTEIGARAIRINPSKNTALLMLDESTNYTPLALNLNLPEVNRNGYLTLGMLDVADFNNLQNYLENSARIEGYRYTPDKGAEILANTFIQNVTIGGALFYKDCTVSGMAQPGIRTDQGLDSYVPTETALRSLGISICGHEYVAESPWQQTVYKPVTQQIEVIPAAPEAVKPKDRK